ncbi:MAG: hypothetical protein Q9208_006237 [Pyrenodesmia sp. 3 TL-2023]
MFETKDTDYLPSYLRQLLLYYMESTGGTITRLLDYQFGILDHKLRAEYRAVYRESPKFAKLPPTNGPRHEETYCLRAYLVNMHTDQHKDAGDWKGGLTGIAQLGDFTGKGMVFKELGIILPGYGSGAAMQFRGTILKHYIGQWTGKCRYAFDHTTHDTVRKAAENLKQKREDGKSSIIFDPDAPEKDKKDNKKNEPKPKPKRKPKAPATSSPKRKTNPTSSTPDDNEEIDDTPEPPTGKRKRSPTSKPDTDDNLGSPLPTRAAKKVKTADGAAAATADENFNPRDEEAAGVQQTERQVAPPQRPKRATRGRLLRKR